MRVPRVYFPTSMEKSLVRSLGRTIRETASGVLSRLLRHPIGRHLPAAVLGRILRRQVLLPDRLVGLRHRARVLPVLLLPVVAILLHLPDLVRRVVLVGLLLRLAVEVRVLPVVLPVALVLLVVPLQAVAVAVVVVQVVGLFSLTLVTPVLRGR